MFDHVETTGGTDELIVTAVVERINRRTHALSANFTFNPPISMEPEKYYVNTITIPTNFWHWDHIWSTNGALDLDFRSYPIFIDMVIIYFLFFFFLLFQRSLRNFMWAKQDQVILNWCQFNFQTLPFAISLTQSIKCISWRPSIRCRICHTQKIWMKISAI